MDYHEWDEIVTRAAVRYNRLVVSLNPRADGVTPLLPLPTVLSDILRQEFDR